MTGRVLIAGVGNIFLGDDGFGAAVADRLAGTDLPDQVAVCDYGISGMHLAFDLADGVQTAIVVDAVPRGGEPGTVYVIEPPRPGHGGEAPGPGGEWPAAVDRAGTRSPGAAGPAGALLDGHGMQPDVVLGMLSTLGGQVDRVLVVGCEPASTEYGIGLSPPVAAAVDCAVTVVLGLIGGHRGSDGDRGDGARDRE